MDMDGDERVWRLWREAGAESWCLAGRRNCYYFTRNDARRRFDVSLNQIAFLLLVHPM